MVFKDQPEDTSFAHIIRETVDINKVDDNGLNLMATAIYHNNEVAFNYIINAVQGGHKVADYNGGVLTPLYIAIITRNVEKVHYLVNHNSIDLNKKIQTAVGITETALSLAIRNKKIQKL